MKKKLTIQAIIRWEQLRTKPFSLMDYTDEEDITALLYTTSMSTTDVMYTLDEFRSAMGSKKVASRIVMDFERETKVAAQFNRQAESTAADAPANDPPYIRDVVSMLVMSGLDAGYAMNEMELCDLPMFITAYEQKRKDQMESDRLWTYLSILPHVDGSKLSSVRDIYPFPWEVVEMKAEADREIQENSEKLELFFKEGKNLINQNYGKQ